MTIHHSAVTRQMNSGGTSAVLVHSKPRSMSSSSWIFRSLLGVIVLILLATTESCFAFVTNRRPRHSSFARIPSIRSIKIERRAFRLQVAKSGGKMIDTEEQFAEMVLADNVPRPVLVFFSAPWCGPCRLTVPVVKDVMKQYSGEIDVVEICTDDLAEVAEDAGVVSIPTIQFYFGGKPLETHSIVGCVAKTVLANAVEKVLEDVAQIRKKQAP